MWKLLQQLSRNPVFGFVAHVEVTWVEVDMFLVEADPFRKVVGLTG